MNLKKCILAAGILIIACSACNMPAFNGTNQANPPVSNPVPLPVSGTLDGGWAGTLNEANTIREVSLVMAYHPATGEVSGRIEIKSGTTVENYPIHGMFVRNSLQFSIPSGVYFTLQFTPGVLDGYTAAGCYECSEQSTGTVKLTQVSTAPPVP